MSPLESCVRSLLCVASFQSGEHRAGEERQQAAALAASRPNAFLRLSSSSKEQLLDNQAQEEQRREMLETVKQLTGGLESNRNSVELEKSKAREAVKSEAPVPHPQEKPALSDEEIERKCKSIIDEFLHINDYKVLKDSTRPVGMSDRGGLSPACEGCQPLFRAASWRDRYPGCREGPPTPPSAHSFPVSPQEAVQCVEELNVPGILPVFVQVGVESTLERSQITRDHMGQLLYQLVQSEKLSKQDFFKGWVSRARELMLVCRYQLEGGLGLRPRAEATHPTSCQQAFQGFLPLWLRFSDTLETADDMAIDIPHIWLYLAELVTPMLKEGGISMRELVIELSAEELNRQLEKLIVEEEAGDEQIFDWVEANLDESQMSSPTFLRALMTAVCKAAVLVDSSSLRVDTAVIKRRVPILLKYLDSDTEKELQALYALQASIVKLDQPPNLLRMFFDCLYDEEVISEDAFYKWESSKDPAEQNGKGVALKSVTAFFTWLREAEEESEDN
ncbi:Eukaryotic translation initiation factor 4 gamma 3, partial [Ophiophagus hannah]